MISKEILSTVMFLAVPLFVFSQNTFINNGTNVGIGTESPTERLEIVADGPSTLQLKNTGNVFGNVGALKFNMAGTHVGGIEMERTVSAGTLSAMKFLVRTGSGATGEFMRITQDQRLGIGTSSPIVKVSVYGANDNDAAISFQSATNSRFYIQQGGSLLKLGGTTQETGVINVTNTGRVGIGTNTPTSTLEVNGDFKLGVSQGGQAYSIGFTRTVGAHIYGTTSTGLTLGGDVNGVDAVVLPNGNVGIGTTNPQAKLAVNGDIFSKRVKVTQQGWADFVFEPEYQLPSLSEMESYIKDNKHLPGVPSAKEVAAEGLDVGEMNKILLQKIEELTLHMIELKKENEEIKKRLTDIGK